MIRQVQPNQRCVFVKNDQIKTAGLLDLYFLPLVAVRPSLHVMARPSSIQEPYVAMAFLLNAFIRLGSVSLQCSVI